MSQTTPQWGASTVDTVTASSDSTALTQGKHYRISATTDLWFKVAVAAGSIAARANGTHFLKSGGEALILVNQAGRSLYYIRESADGHISISEVEV
jgi:hypothetical protein